MLFRDRREAGRLLAARLSHLRDAHPMVLGLPRGGVIVAHEVARALGAPLDVLVVRKIGAPDQPELAIGAVIASDPPQRVLNERFVRLLQVDESYLEEETRRQTAEAQRRDVAYRGGRPPLDVAGRTVIVVDDGIATGATMAAALRALRGLHPRRIVVAVPVGAPDSLDALARDADEVVVLDAPPDFRSVGEHYEEFAQTSDEEVVRALAESA
jgi:putative phosphoribosyl transferase